MNGRRGGHHGVRAEDHFVARPESRRPQRQVQGVGGVGHPHDVLGAEVAGKVALELLQVPLQDEGAAAAHVRDHLHQPRLVGDENVRIVEKRNRARRESWS